MGSFLFLRECYIIKQMTKNIRKLLVTTILAGALLAPELATAKDNVIFLPSGSDRTKSVVIDDGRTRMIIRTDEASARQIQRMLRRSDRVIIRTPSYGSSYGYGYYPGYYPDYYNPNPYTGNRGLGYALGRAVGSKID